MNFKWWPIRRSVQFGTVALIASPLYWPGLFRGNLSSGELFGLNLADPLAFFQATLASRLFVPSFFVAAVIVAAFYFVVGGRTFCGWVCPVGLITELMDKLRCRLGTGRRTFPLSGTRWSLWTVIAVSLLAGVPLFEIVSPIGMAARAIMFSSWQPLFFLLAIVVVEVAIARRIWCRSLCPVGGLYALLGRFSPLKIGFTKDRCTACGACSEVCPVEEVLEPSLVHGARQVVSGDCIRCGDCSDVCPTRALTVTTGYK